MAGLLTLQCAGRPGVTSPDSDLASAAGQKFPQKTCSEVLCMDLGQFERSS